MLNKQDLQSLGYEIKEDPDQPGKFYWRCDQDGSEISYDSEAAAVLAAGEDACETFDLHRCDNCNKVFAKVELAEAKHLAMRTDPGGVVPSGECPDCKALCYPLEKDPDWETVMDYFGLDHSFCWTDADVISYTKQYLDAVAKTDKAIAFVKRVAALKKWGERDIAGEPFEPSDGIEDSHKCLMNLIDHARALGI